MSLHGEGSLQDKVMQTKGLSRRAPGKSFAIREITGQQLEHAGTPWAQRGGQCDCADDNTGGQVPWGPVV